jgi:peroxiredoxin
MTRTVPAVGSAAPDFTVDTTSGSKLTLSSFKGSRHVLLAFFPLAFTPTCTAELCAFSEDYSAFEGEDVVVVPISVDAVPSLREFKAKYGMTTELASDFLREVSRAYGTLREDRFYAQRAYFLIDKEGILRWSFVETVSGARRENEELLAEIARLKA